MCYEEATCNSSLLADTTETMQTSAFDAASSTRTYKGIFSVSSAFEKSAKKFCKNKSTKCGSNARTKNYVAVQTA